MRYLTKLGLAVLTVWLDSAAPLVVPTAFADNTLEQMQFIGEPPSTPIEVYGNAWTIFADGVIDADAGKRLKEFIEAKHIPNKSMLVLNSPGGNLLAA